MTTACAYTGPAAYRFSPAASLESHVPGEHWAYRLYRGLFTSETHQSSPSTTRYGRAVPGSPARPNASVSVKVPAGVRVVVSLAPPTPAAPPRAGTGPSTAVQPVGRRSHAVRVAVVALAEAATTVTTCVEEPGSTPR